MEKLSGNIWKRNIISHLALAMSQNSTLVKKIVSVGKLLKFDTKPHFITTKCNIWFYLKLKKNA